MANLCKPITGQGTLTLANEDCYKGSFINGMAEGMGVFRYHNGQVYTGEMRGGKRMGQGVLTFTNGNSVTRILPQVCE